MFWWIVWIPIVCQGFFFPCLGQPLAQLKNRGLLLAGQFFIAFLLMIPERVAHGNLGQWSVPYMLVGAINAYAFYAFWRSMALNMVMAVLAWPLASLIAVAAATRFISGEAANLSDPMMLTGAGLLFLSGFAAVLRFAKHKQATRQASHQFESQTANNLKCAHWVFWAAILMAGVAFGVGYASRQEPLDRHVFVSSMFLGSCIGGFLVHISFGEQWTRTSKKQLALVLLLGLTSFINLNAHKWCLQIGPLVVYESMILSFRSLLMLGTAIWHTKRTGLPKLRMPETAVLAIAIVGLVLMTIAL